MPAFDATAQLVHHDLLTITNAKDGNTHVKRGLGRAGASLTGDTIGTTGKDDRLGRELGQKCICDVLIWVDFAIDVQLAQAPRDQLRDLAAEVDDEKFLCVSPVIAAA